MSNIYHGQHIEQQLRGLTVYLARVIGLTVILLVAGFLARGSTLIMATIADGPAPSMTTARSSKNFALNAIPGMKRGFGIHAVRTATPTRIASTSASSSWCVS
jgi:hypothetical protein